MGLRPGSKSAMFARTAVHGILGACASIDGFDESPGAWRNYDERTQPRWRSPAQTQ